MSLTSSLSGRLSGVLRIIRRAAWLLALAFLLRFSTLPLGESWARIGAMVSDVHFDYIGWTLQAMASKTAESLWGAHPYMSEIERSEFTRRYFADVARAQHLEGQIEAIYADPAVSDPTSASADLRAERDALRTDLSQRQALVEAVIEGQVDRRCGHVITRHRERLEQQEPIDVLRD